MSPTDTTRRDLLAGTAAFGAGDVLPFVRQKKPAPRIEQATTADELAAFEFEGENFEKSLDEWRALFTDQWTGLAIAIQTIKMDHGGCANLVRDLDEVSEDALPDLVDQLRTTKEWFKTAAGLLENAELRLMCGAHRHAKETGA